VLRDTVCAYYKYDAYHKYDTLYNMYTQKCEACTPYLYAYDASLMAPTVAVGSLSLATAVNVYCMLYAAVFQVLTGVTTAAITSLLQIC
jgi:hypothetical protein